MERKISTISLFKSSVCNAGTTRYSDPIDLRDISAVGSFALSYSVGVSGGVATCGSSNFLYQYCPVYDSTYVTPTNGTFGTLGNSGGTGIVSFSPPVFPFMKIGVAIGTSGTSLVTAELHVR